MAFPKLGLVSPFQTILSNWLCQRVMPMSLEIRTAWYPLTTGRGQSPECRVLQGRQSWLHAAANSPGEPAGEGGELPPEVGRASHLR